MALTQTFSSLLKNYRPINILKDEVKKRDYMFRNINKDRKWKGGRYQIPVNVGVASSVKFGALTAAANISEAQTALGYETDYIEIDHALKFNQRDLASSDNYEGSFIKAMNDTISPAANFYKEVISHSLLLGSRIDSLTVNGTSSGVAAVSFPERFEVGQKCQIQNNDPAALDVFVIAVDLNAKTVTVSATAGGSALDIQAYTIAKDSGLYFDGTMSVPGGVAQNTMNSFKDGLLSATNGGSASLHNITKASYKQWQAHNEDLSGASAETLLEELFKIWVIASRKGRGMPSEILISFDNYQYIVNSLETNRRFSASDLQAGYGFSSCKITGPSGALKVTALREMDNDIALVVDWNSFKLAGMKFFESVKSNRSGESFFEVRETTGYSYIMDIAFYGNLIFHHPSYNGIGFGISI